MHLRPKCSSALVLLIVHIDDLKSTDKKSVIEVSDI